MATRTQSKAPTNSTDILFRAWGSEFDAAMTAAGLVDTAATGGINFTTVLHPTAAGTKTGFKVYRFADALQSSSPIFIKANFGSGDTGANSPAIWLTIGTQHDGAGSLSGNVTDEFEVQSNSGTATTTTYSCNSSGSTSRIAIQMFAGSDSAFLFFIDRIKADDGTNSDSGVIFGATDYISSIGSFGCVYKEGTGGTFYRNAQFVVAVPKTGTGIAGADTGLYSPKFFKGVELNNPDVVLLFFRVDITQGTQFSATVNGSVHTYRAVSTTVTNNYVPTDGRANEIMVAIRWE